jgi:hypothetical protein
MVGRRQPKASNESTLRELEHSLRNQLWALTMRVDLTAEQAEQLRAELRERLAATEKRLEDLGRRL